MKLILNQVAQTVEIRDTLNGSTFEIINAQGETIGGNFVFLNHIRRRAIDRLQEGTKIDPTTWPGYDPLNDF